jgi:ATP-dependent helicase/nuclease subunit A
MNDTTALHDGAERAAALDAARSFIVQAPAGSGKTELLIQRYLALLAQVERPEAIVAMTFTRKAAGEIRERIVTALREQDPPPSHAHNRVVTWRLARAALERDAALGWELAMHPARLQVHTIDALCFALMRQAPLTVKLGALPRPVERAERLHLEAAREELMDAGPDDDAWRRLLEHLDNDGERAVRLIADLLAKREQWLRHLVRGDRPQLRGQLEHALEAEIASELGTLASLFPPAMLDSLAELSRYAAVNLAARGKGHPLEAYAESRGLPPSTAEGLGHWQALAAWLLKGKAEIRLTVDVRHGFPPDRATPKRAMEALLRELAAIPAIGRALEIVRTLPPPRYDDAAWSFVEALLVVLPRAAARLRLIFARHDMIDFNEATLVALEALQSEEGPSDLLLALDTRIDHLLVDEFQDTSFAQWDLVERLTAGWSPGDGRTLFLVGDPMQSIYKFRDANVSLFLEARRRQAIGDVVLEPLTLASNFRSQCGLVDWINRTFPRVLPARDDPVRGAVAFTPSHPAVERRLEPAVTLDLTIDPRREADAVVSRIETALATDAESIAVLVRKRTDLEEILPALRARNIPFAAVELDRLSERQAMLDIAALTHALIQPYDRTAWLAMLRAPWCGLTLADLFALTDACGELPLVDALHGELGATVRSRLSPDGRIRFERFATALMPALLDRGRTALARRVRGVWLALGGAQCLSEPAIDLPAGEQMFGLIAEHAIGDDLPDWPAFVAAVEMLFAKSEVDAATRVQLMTLHKAKGLEFDVVVMPGLTRPPGSGDSQLLLWRERAAGLLLAPMRARDRPKGEDDAVHAYLRVLARDEDDHELRRLLYVGCTRARQSLHLTAVLGVEEDTEGALCWKTPARGTPLAALWPALTPGEPPVPTDPVARRPRVAGVPLVRLPLDWRLPSPPGSVALVSEPPIREESEPIEFDWVRETARQIGTVAHRLLHRMAVEGLERWTGERIAAERPRVQRELAQAGFTGAEATAAVEEVLSALVKTRSDPRGRWLFDARHVDARSEFAVTQSRAGAFVHRVLDRTFVDTNGTRWIVDFKLSRHQGAGLESFLDRERERYAEQLEGYAEALRALDARPIRLGLYFPLLGGWREWGTGSDSTFDLV